MISYTIQEAAKILRAKESEILLHIRREDYLKRDASYSYQRRISEKTLMRVLKEIHGEARNIEPYTELRIVHPTGYMCLNVEFFFKTRTQTEIRRILALAEKNCNDDLRIDVISALWNALASLEDTHYRRRTTLEKHRKMLAWTINQLEKQEWTGPKGSVNHRGS